MANRFTETDKWQDRWFRQLEPAHKLAWLYLLDCCDTAGVIELDESLANFQIGADIDWQSFIEASEGRIEHLANHKYWIPKFIKRQYPKGLNRSSRPQASVISKIQYHNLEERVCKAYGESYLSFHDIDIDTDKETDIEKEQITQVVESYQEHHPRSRPGKKERRKIVERLHEGFTVEDLQLAIEGNHVSPFHCGQNDSGQKYHNLELIVRDAGKVSQFIELAGQHGGPVLSEKTRRSLSAIDSWLSRGGEDGHAA